MISIAVIIYLSLFVSSFLAATVLPLAPDILAGKMAADGHALFLIIAVATLGSYLGSCTTYFLGYLSPEKIIKIVENYLSGILGLAENTTTGHFYRGVE